MQFNEYTIQWNNRSIPVRVARQLGKVYIECDAPGPFLLALNPKQVDTEKLRSLPASATLKGVVIPEIGGFLDLFDCFGSMLKDSLKVDSQKLLTLLENTPCPG